MGASEVAFVLAGAIAAILLIGVLAGLFRKE